MNFKQVVLRMDGAVCRECRRSLERGQTVLQGYRRDETGVMTKEFCSAECLAEYKEKRESAASRMLNRLAVKFN